MADILEAAQDQINDAATKLTSQSPATPDPLAGQILTPLAPAVAPNLAPPPPTQAPTLNPMVPEPPTTESNQFVPSAPLSPVVPMANMPPLGQASPSTTDIGISLSPPPPPLPPTDNTISPAFTPGAYQGPTTTPVETINLGTQFTTPAPLVADGSPTMVVPPQGSGGGKKGGKGKLFAVLAIVILAIVLPVGAYFLSSNKNLADLRGRAEGTCDNGVAVGGTACQSQGDSVMYRCDAPNPNQVWTSISCNGGTCQGTACTSGSGGGGGQQCPAGNNGQGGQTCDNQNKCDIAGGCNGACGGNGYAPSGQTCDVPNGYCRSGFSCRPNDTGYHLTCAGDQCVQQLCPSGQASCANACSSHSECQATSTPACTSLSTKTSCDANTNCAWYACSPVGGAAHCNPKGTLMAEVCGCKRVGQTCESSLTGSVTSCCPDENLVCQNPTGSVPTCQQTAPGASGHAFCGPASQLLCSRVRAHKCTSLNAQGQCNDNGITVTNLQEALNYAGSCGQVDTVCNGGDKDGQLCGGYRIINTNCPGDSTPLTCNQLDILDSTGANITASVVQGSRKLVPNESITLSTPKGTAVAARFRLYDTSGATDPNSKWMYVTQATGENLQKQTTVDITQAAGKMEVELCAQALDSANGCPSGWK